MVGYSGVACRCNRDGNSNTVMGVSVVNEERLFNDIADIREDVTMIKTSLLGANGECGFIKKTNDDIHALDCRQRILTRNYWLLVGTLIGSGLLVGGVVQLI